MRWDCNYLANLVIRERHGFLAGRAEPQPLADIVYFDEKGEVQKLMAKKQQFRRLKNYFTGAMLYQDAHDSSEEPVEESYDNGNDEVG